MNKLFIFIILILIIATIYFNLILNKNDLDIEIKTNELENEDEDEQDVLHSEDIDSMFNISDEKQEEEEDMNSKNIVYLDIEVNNNRGRILISLNNKIILHNFYNYVRFICK